MIIATFIKVRIVRIDMWDKDESIEALKDLLEVSYTDLDKLLQTLWHDYAKNPTPNMHLFFLAGKFSHLFNQRLKQVKGEETRETLHIVLNEILKDDRVKVLMNTMVSDASQKVTGV